MVPGTFFSRPRWAGAARQIQMRSAAVAAVFRAVRHLVIECNFVLRSSMKRLLEVKSVVHGCDIRSTPPPSSPAIAEQITPVTWTCHAPSPPAVASPRVALRCSVKAGRPSIRAPRSLSLRPQRRRIMNYAGAAPSPLRLSRAVTERTVLAPVSWLCRSAAGRPVLGRAPRIHKLCVVTPERKQNATQAPRQADHGNPFAAPGGELLGPLGERRRGRAAPVHPGRLH